MSIVLQFDPRAKITYAYHNETTWDRETRRTKSKRTLIGKLDTQSGEIIPSSGKHRRNPVDEAVVREEIEKYNRRVAREKHPEQVTELQLEEKICHLQAQYEKLASQMEKINTLLTSLAQDITKMNS